MRKRFSKLDREEIIRAANTGGWLDLQELALVTRFDYDKVRQWKHEGLPLIGGRIKLADAEAWLKTTFLKPQASAIPARGAGPPSTFRLKYL